MKADPKNKLISGKSAIKKYARQYLNLFDEEDYETS